MNSHLKSPPGALGALYFLPGQYLFKRIEEGREVVKALSSEQISRAFREYRTDTGWIRRQVLRYREEPEKNYLLSVEAAGMKTIFVETRDGKIAEVNVPLPTLVLFGRGNEFYLWAAKSKNIEVKTKLFVAPFPNIGGNASGKICFGSNQVPEARIENLDEIWNLIFKTPFNRDNAGTKCHSEPGDVRTLLFNLAKRGAKRFPVSELIKTSATIADLWTQGAEKYYS